MFTVTEWTVLHYITFGLTFAAFVCAAVLAASIRGLKTLEKHISYAPDEHRPALVKETLEQRFHIKTAKLAPAKAYVLAIEQIQARRSLLQSVLVTVCSVAVLLSFVVVVWIVSFRQQPPQVVKPLTTALCTKPVTWLNAQSKGEKAFTCDVPSGPIKVSFKGRVEVQDLPTHKISGAKVGVCVFMEGTSCNCPSAAGQTGRGGCFDEHKGFNWATLEPSLTTTTKAGTVTAVLHIAYCQGNPGVDAECNVADGAIIFESLAPSK